MWEVWCALAGRWLTLSDLRGSIEVAIDLTQAESLMNIVGMKTKLRRRVLAGLLVMERAALAELFPEQDARDE